jgi:hypothetical protein
MDYRTWIRKIVLLTPTLSIMSCGSSTIETKIVDSSAYRTGSLSVHIQCVDTTPALHFLSAVGSKVLLEGTNLAGTSDSNGSMNLSNIPQGTYDISVSKKGFGLCRYYGIPVLQGTPSVLPPLFLGLAPTQTMIFDSVVSVSKETIQIRVRDSTIYGGIIVAACFADLDSSAEPGAAHYAMDVFYRSSKDIYLSLNTDTVKSGTTLYLSGAYFNSRSSSDPNNSSNYYANYWDSHANTFRFISTGPKSNVLKITIP